MPNGDPGKFVIPQVEIVAMFNLIRSEDVGLTWLKIVGKWISKIVNLQNTSLVLACLIVSPIIVSICHPFLLYSVL